VSDLNYCYLCGISELDGAPDLGVPYPEVKERSGVGMTCKECYEEINK